MRDAQPKTLRDLLTSLGFAPKPWEEDPAVGYWTQAGSFAHVLCEPGGVFVWYASLGTGSTYVLTNSLEEFVNWLARHCGGDAD